LPNNEAAAPTLQKQLSINKTICNILVNRGFSNYDDAKSFFRPELTQLHSPWLMKDMQEAVNRITTAFEQKEKILIFGDYDVDGTTSVAVLYQFFCKIYTSDSLGYYIPHRYKEGYGISKLGIDYAKENNFSLIISIDCGIKSVELVDYAATLGIDFIICDHHLPDKILPKAVAILNPKQVDCNYPYKELCGCGVGFKLITALANHFNIDEEHYFCYLDLVATAIAADIVPITGENRILTFYGLKQINDRPNPGIKALIELGGIKNKLTINNVVFVIAPRVNAAGRMDDAKKAVQLFVEKDEQAALKIAALLHSDNTERKEADQSITADALALIEADEVLINRKTTVLFKEDWHKGVVGIVASRLTEKYYRPTVVLTKSNGLLSGSARSVVGYNLYEAVHACKQYLLNYGGHVAAAGLTLLPENFDAFSTAFEQVVSKTISEELLTPQIIIDAEITFSEITQSFYNIICQMEPFGPENMRPTFVAKNVLNTPYSKIVKEQHIRFVLQQNGVTLTGIGFNLAEKFCLLQLNQPLDVVFTIDINEWNGNTTLQIKVIDFRISEQ
jgi:single-stranded-DNA-specific exonuclease